MLESGWHYLSGSKQSQTPNKAKGKEQKLFLKKKKRGGASAPT